MATSNVKKKSTAGGGKFSYKYTDLATIHEELEKQGITYYQYTEYDERAQADYIYTVLKYGDDETKPLRGVKIIEGNTLSGGNIAQQYGAILTYCRRYSLLLALGWATEDDDTVSVQPADNKQTIRSDAPPTEKQLRFIAKLMREQGQSDAIIQVTQKGIKTAGEASRKIKELQS